MGLNIPAWLNAVLLDRQDNRSGRSKTIGQRVKDQIQNLVNGLRSMNLEISPIRNAEILESL
jgi:hypothetical protein